MSVGQGFPVARSCEAAQMLLGCSSERIATWLALFGCAGVSATLAAASLYIARKLVGAVSIALGKAAVGLARQAKARLTLQHLFARPMTRRVAAVNISRRRRLS